MTGQATPPPGRTGLGRRRRTAMLAASAVALVLLAVGAAVVVGPTLRSPAQLAADAAPPAPSLVTVPAERRVLAEAVVLRGTVRPGARVAVTVPASATGPDNVITDVRVAAGDRLREGRVIVERSGEPMFGLVLPFPLYRDVRAGHRGPDVREVQRALRRLGHGGPVSGTFDSATQRALAALYRAHGYAVPRDGGPAAQPGGGAAAGAGTAAGAPLLLRSAVLVLDRAGRKVSRVRVRVGDILAEAGTALVELDRKPPTLVGVAAPDQVPLLRPGQAATVTDDASGGTARAEVGSVGDRQVTGADGAVGVEVRFRLTKGGPGAESDRSVRIDVEAASGRAPVLAVPVSAVFSRVDGTTFLTVARPGGRTEDVTVRTGQIAGGWVEIRPATGGRVAAGVEVVVGERAPLGER